MSRSSPARSGGALISLCFFVSGFAALIYQTAWTRQFAFVFGTSELAVATVLAAYMGGLAAGAHFAARLAPRIQRPVRVYASVELGIAAAALLVPLFIDLATRLHAHLFSSTGLLAGEGGLATMLFYLVSSFVILLVPTALMGATLPLLARHAVRTNEEIGTRIGSLYAINTVGAVAGTLLSGFVLLPEIGLRQTVFVAVAGNALVFVLAAFLATSAPLPRSFTEVASRAFPSDRRRWILPLVAVSGSVSFLYEVLWTRLLGHVFGGSVYAFATMLASFLSGIAIGSWLAARRARNVEESVRGFAGAQLGTAAFSVLAFAMLDRVAPWSRQIEVWVGDSLTADALCGAFILLPSAVCIGATFPFAVRIFALGPASASAASARVYSWNTVGAIIGAVGSGFFLIPAIGFAPTLALAVALNLALAATTAAILPTRAHPFAWLAAGGLALLVLSPPSAPWLLLRNNPMERSPGGGSLFHFSTGRTASVMLRETRGAWRLSTNGLPEALILPRGAHPGTLPAGQWLGAAGVLARPDAKSAFMVGLGGGTALEYMPGSLETIDVVEIEAEVVEANRLLSPLRRQDPLADPRIRVTLNDARSALALTEKRYDLIISQPSHPWTPSGAHLYSYEFFEIARDHLREGGVLVQWMGLSFVDGELLKTLVATARSVFSFVRVHQPGRGAILLLASDEPLDLEANVEAAIANGPRVFPLLGVYRPEDVAATLVLDDEAATRFAAGSEPSRDDLNVLQWRSPQLMRGREAAFDREKVFGEFEVGNRPGSGWDEIYLVEKTASIGLHGRARRLAGKVEEPARRTLALGLAAYARLDMEVAVRLLEESLDAASALPETERIDFDWARIALLRLAHYGFGTNLEPASLRRGLLRRGSRALVAAWAAQRAADMERLRALDARLAEIESHQPGFGDARGLRALWRVELGEAREAREALVLIDTMGRLFGGPEILATRARAAAKAGLPRGALHTLYRLGRIAKPGRQSQQAAADGLVVLEALPEGLGSRAQREKLRRKLAHIGNSASGDRPPAR